MSKKLEILNQVILGANRAENLAELLDNILNSTLKLMDFDGGGIYIVDEISRTALISHHKGLPLDFIKNVNHIKINEGIYRKIFIEGEPIFTDNYPDINPERAKKWGLLSLASVPMFAKDQIIGALNIASKSRYAFSREEKSLLLSISREAGTVIAKMKAEEKLRESEEKFRTIADQSLMGIAILQNDIFKYANRQFEVIYGYSLEELKSWQPGEYIKLVHPDFKDFVMEQAEKKQLGLDGVIPNYQFKAVKKNGDTIWIEIFSKTMHYEGRPSDLIALVDITEKKEAEQKLLESEVKYREAYNRAEFYKDLFAHDINNILQNINSSKELLEIYKNRPDKMKNFRDLINIIDTQVIRGARLVDNIRKLSQLEESNIINEPIDINSILDKAISYIKSTFQDKKITIQVDSYKKNIFLKASDFLLDVFENLLINAVNHNQHQQIEIQIKISKEQKDEKDFVKIQFIDNGFGIEDSRKEKIFQRGYSQQKISGGMGLGLSLVKKIIDSYNGKIWVKDKVKGDYKKGSNFIILIPEIN